MELVDFSGNLPKPFPFPINYVIQNRKWIDKLTALEDETLLTTPAETYGIIHSELDTIADSHPKNLIQILSQPAPIPNTST